MKMSLVDIQAVLRANNHYVLLAKLHGLWEKGKNEVMALLPFFISGRMTFDARDMSNTELREKMSVIREIAEICKTSRVLTGSTLSYMLNTHYIERYYNGAIGLHRAVGGDTSPERMEAYAEMIQEMLTSRVATNFYMEHEKAPRDIVLACAEFVNMVQSGKIMLPTVGEVLREMQ